MKIDEIKTGDKVVCVSIVPNSRVIEIYGDKSFESYERNLKPFKIYTISYISKAENGFSNLEPITIFNDDSLGGYYYVAPENLISLKEYRKQKLEKLNSL
jgi:hypothetical protein